MYYDLHLTYWFQLLENTQERIQLFQGMFL